MKASKVNRLYEKLHRSLPEARSELVYEDTFQLLIAVILSAQATDKSVNAVTPGLFEKHSNPQAILDLGEARLRKKIQTIGLAPTKAKNIIRTCGLLLEEYNGKVPDNREALETLPGVGRKTANVVLNEGFGQPTIAVDTHVFRLANRTGLAPGKNVLETELKLLKVTPDPWKKNAHRYLILHGRYVCKAKGFDCKNCAIVKECEYPAKNL
ncbi:MAG: endonuclease III [Nitrospinaceae bacterium]|nr:endonuclease III [Nitrospinaceae bacterium]NIR57587.1 endonuclease III [Nitrospinaceae bacterium]NIS88057.1 endonuclease III [Nitrospinaceae bacterium]NIT84921.1 endonuclease III [Nitrospinaceae bacterium]NIU47097.1 endonuclease III [Nitrospinaceae bacterium]